jgi:hypothetical protein
LSNVDLPDELHFERRSLMRVLGIRCVLVIVQ